MINDLWINLPVKDVTRSKEFFTRLGFSLNSQYGNSEQSGCLLVGNKKVVVMLFNETTFKGFTNAGIADTHNAAEVLLSIGVDTKEEVDEIAAKAVAAGAQCNHTPHEMKGWMYGCVFTDIDGHKWNLLFMDMSKMTNS